MSAEDQNMETVENTQEDDRKIFVGGLPQDVNDTDIQTHFGKFGEIETVSLKIDSATGRSRGFAFVVFKNSEAVDATVAQEEHTVKNKKVAVKKAQAKQGKVFVCKLKPEITEEMLREFFSQYGPIVNLEQPIDKTKNEKKNFCFITFEKEEQAKKLLQDGVVTLDGTELEVKRVTQKQDMRFPGRGGRGGHAGGFWGAGYGDYYGWGGYGPADYYGPGWGGWGPYTPGPMAYGGGGKTPRGTTRGAGVRGRGTRGLRSKPY